MLSSFPRALSRTLRPAGLAPSRKATAHQDVLDEEAGLWSYLVVDPSGIRAREDACYGGKSTKRSDVPRFKEGTVVEIDRRRRSGWTLWLHLKHYDCWVFDVSPKDKTVRMVEIEVVTGEWAYEACCFERVPILPFPKLAGMDKKGFKVGAHVLDVHEVVSVMERVRPVSVKGSFLRLSDGRGWVLDFADGRRLMQRRVATPMKGGGMPGGEDIATAPPPPGADSKLANPHSGSRTVPRVSPDTAEPRSPEAGQWDYVVLDHRGISLRGQPTYDPAQKLQRRVEEGEVVSVVERRPGDGMTFLRLACPQGWVFDRQPGKVSHVRMMEVKVERGLWHYMVMAPKGIAVRSRCSFSETVKVGKGPQKGAVIAVAQRVKVGATTFLRLRDGAGWIFDCKNPRDQLAKEVVVQAQPTGTVGTISNPSGVSLLSSPSNETWAVTHMRLLQHAHVQISYVYDSLWAFVVKVGCDSMEGWVLMEDIRVTSTNSMLGPC